MSTTLLKLIALILMLTDHIGEFIPGAPIALRWLGRLSAPLFMYCMVWGLHYTHDRKLYLLRMYLFGCGMAILDLVLNSCFSNPYTSITNNIFVTLLLGGMIIDLIERTKANRRKSLKLWCSFFLLQLGSTLLIIGSYSLFPNLNLQLFLGALLPNLHCNEGSIIFVGLVVLLYYIKDSKRSTILGYGIFCLVYAGLSLYSLYSYSSSDVLYNLFFLDYQWMMIGALPFMLTYNGQKGRGLKYFFYFFYPLHIAILFLLGNLCF